MPLTYQATPDLLFDSRRAAWLANERALVIADLHLGYAWAHRAGGQLMPILGTEDTVQRLLELRRDYEATEIVFLGDIVHRAIPVSAIETEVRAIVQALAPQARLTFVAGNHDRDLQPLLKRWRVDIALVPSRTLGPYTLTHGDQPLPLYGKHTRTIMGHEHPAISIGDGVTTSQKCPCFLISDSVIILPAFSQWAAGTNIRAYPFSSDLARSANFTRAIAICGKKLLPIRL
jgi:DNA ligase-associated metallophosphoesterase